MKKLIHINATGKAGKAYCGNTVGYMDALQDYVGYEPLYPHLLCKTCWKKSKFSRGGDGA
jgi:hypothetical protein